MRADAAAVQYRSGTLEFAALLERAPVYDSKIGSNSGRILNYGEISNVSFGANKCLQRMRHKKYYITIKTVYILNLRVVIDYFRLKIDELVSQRDT